MRSSLLRAFHVCGKQFNSRQPSGLNKLAIDRETCSGSVDAGFILVLPFQNRYLGLTVEVSTRGAYVRDKNTSARLCAKNAGGGHICRTLW